MTYWGGLKAALAGVIVGQEGAGSAAWSVAEMSEDESVAFQNKLAFSSRTGSPVCL